jgi:hypothetical protein
MPLKWIAGASTVLVLVFGVWKIEDRYATASDVAHEVIKLQQEDEVQNKKLDGLTIEIEMGKLDKYRDSLQSRVWKLDDRYGIGCAECEEAVREVYEQTVRDIIKIDGKLKELGGSQ